MPGYMCYGSKPVILRVLVLLQIITDHQKCLLQNRSSVAVAVVMFECFYIPLQFPSLHLHLQILKDRQLLIRCV